MSARQGPSLKIRRDVTKCHGCRACEIMCSFHHKGSMAPSASSIRIIRDNAEGRILWSVDETCDSCQEEAVPFCKKYCLYGAIEVAP